MTGQLITAFRLSLAQQLRNRISLILFMVIPSVFFLLTILTTKDEPVLFRLTSLGEERMVSVSKLNEALTFMALSSIGLLAAFLGMVLLQKDRAACRRLVNSGYRPGAIILAKLLLLGVIVLLLGLFVFLFMLAFFSPADIPRLYAGLCLIGFVYGAYGMLVGALVKRELEGILLVALIVNIDVGWLQNPLFYADAMNKAIIRWLPAFYPCQVSMISAFTRFSIAKPFLFGALYGLAFLGLGMLAYGFSVRVTRRVPGRGEEEDGL